MNSVLPNFSSGFFNSMLAEESTYSTSSGNDSSITTESGHPGSPIARSSPVKNSLSCPRNLRLLEVNFQSIVAKRAEFWAVLDAVRPDVVFGSETWLNPNISNSEIFPTDYRVYRSDRGDGYGGWAFLRSMIAYAVAKWPLPPRQTLWLQVS